jgi:glycosyltransferase involved in cell wall biosynthesis
MAPPSTEGRPRILLLTKVPPSNSGIAHFAPAFRRTLELVGDVTTIELAVDAAETQRLAVIARTVAHVRRALRAQPVDLVVVHLSGRALGEYYAAVAALAHRSRPRVWLVVHDAPELAGASLLVAPLDRRGGRRIGMLGSRHIGRRLDRHLLDRADAVIAFSESGAAALVDREPTTRAVALPLPVELAPATTKEPVVYVPAGLVATDVDPVLAAVARLGQDRTDANSYRVRVGHLGPDGSASVRAMAARRGLGDRLELTGFLDDRGLDRSFATASVVVRNRRATETGNRNAASGPVVLAMAAGAAVVATDPRGSAACLAGGAGIDLSAEPGRLTDAVAALLADPAEIARLGVAALAHIRDHHRPECVAARLDELWRSQIKRT